MVVSLTFGHQTWLHMEVSKFSYFIHVGGPRQQNHHAINVWILNNPQPQQTQSEKKAIDQKKKES
jgi:hypothetical protein